MTGGTGGSFATKIAAAAVGGFASGYITTGTFKGGVWGAVSAVAFAYVGARMPQAQSFLDAAHQAKIVVHGVVGGIMAVAQGGSFKNGFASAAAAQFMAPAIDGAGFDGAHEAINKAIRIIAAGAVGGITARVTGGDVSMGIAVAMFSRAFNDGLHEGHNVKMKYLSTFGSAQKMAESHGLDLAEDQNGNLLMTGEVGYDADQKDIANTFVENVNATYIVREGGKKISLTVRLSLATEGGGDIRIVGFNSLYSKVSSIYTKNEFKGLCKGACAVKALGAIHFESISNAADRYTGLHEVFHIWGFDDLGFSGRGLMKNGNAGTPPIYGDFSKLKKDYL